MKLPVDSSVNKILSHLDLSNVEEANVWADALIMFIAMLRRSILPSILNVGILPFIHGELY